MCTNENFDFLQTRSLYFHTYNNENSKALFLAVNNGIMTIPAKHCSSGNLMREQPQHEPWCPAEPIQAS